MATGFAGAQQLLRIERHVWQGAAPVPSIEVAFGLTSRAAAAASAADLLHDQRAHWGAIETGQHYRRDVTFREDQSPVRDPNATPSYAALRSVAIFLCVQRKRTERRPQEYHLPDFLRYTRKRCTQVIRWFTQRYAPP